MISGSINKNRAKMAFGVDHSRLVDQQEDEEEFDMTNLFTQEKKEL